LPGAYQLPTNFAVLSWEAISNIWQVQQMMQSHGDLQQNLLLYIQLVSTGAASDTSLLVLQKATGWDPVVVAALLSGPLQAVTVVTLQLNRLQTCIDVMSRLGANPGFMQSMVDVAALPGEGELGDVEPECRRRAGQNRQYLWYPVGERLDAAVR
jgi:hypothetical protein